MIRNNFGLVFDFNSGKVGVSKAKELAFTARMINGEEAANLGLVNRCGKYSKIIFNNRSRLKGLCGLQDFLLKVPEMEYKLYSKLYT